MGTTPSDSPVADTLRTALERALGAQYEVLGLLGRGGMGAVYLARERLLERLVAIKVLPSENADHESRERFLREARTAAQLSHANIVPLLSFGELGDTLFYIMRYVDGESLAVRLAREGRLAPLVARRILSELSDALAEAHRRGIVHRDIKPDNVMIERETGRAMLTDFGIARRFASSATLTGTGMILGSPKYMSPEQAAGDRTVDGRSDLYSLGILGFQMLTGGLPFAGASVQELLAQQITADAPRIGALAPETPLDLSSALMRCMEKDPAKRWADAGALRFALAANTHEAFQLPDALERLPALGTKLLSWSYVTAVGLMCEYAYTDDTVWPATAALIPAIGIGGMLGWLALFAKRMGVSRRRALAIAFWPSARNATWWPRTLRPPGDIWDRLPAPVRRMRMIVTVAIVTITFVTVPLWLTGMNVGIGEIFPPDARHELFRRLMLSGFGVMLAAMSGIFGASIVGLRWRRRFMLSDHEANKLLTEPTHGSRFWERPSIAALLSNADSLSSARPTTGDEMADAVRALASELPASADSIATEAADAARDLASALRELEARIGEFAQQADVAEQRRLEGRIAALGTERRDEPDVARQMRTLLQGQLALFAQLDSRRERLEARRDALREQLRTLWLQMMNYRAQATAQSGDISELTGRLRALCQSIERRASAIEETERLLS